MFDICDYEIENKYKQDYDVGIKFSNKHGEFISVPSYSLKNRKRVLTLKGSSYRGISIGAIHYYGRFQTYSSSFKCLKSYDNCCKVNKIYDISGAFDKPDIIEGLTILLTRPLIKEDLKNKHRYGGHYKIGDMSENFMKANDVIIRAVEILKKCFDSRKWIIDDGYFIEEYCVESELPKNILKYFNIQRYED